MLKLSTLDTPKHRRLVIEGKLTSPWASELTSAWRQATEGLDGRELVIDLKCLIAIDEGGENKLLEMMRGGAVFRASGVFTKHVLKRLARKIRKPHSGVKK